MVAESNNETATEYPENGKPGLKKKATVSQKKNHDGERENDEQPSSRGRSSKGGQHKKEHHR